MENIEPKTESKYVTPLVYKEAIPYPPTSGKRKKILRAAKTDRRLFAKAYLKARGNATLAMKAIKPHLSNPSATVMGSQMIHRQDVKQEIEKLLDEAGMPKDYFIMKMKDLAEIKDAKGNPIAAVQWDVVKTGLEFHGLINKKAPPQQPMLQVNYNIDAERLGGVLSKLSEVTRKLDLSNINRGAEDANIIDNIEGNNASEVDPQGEEHSSEPVQP